VPGDDAWEARGRLLVCRCAVCVETRAGGCDAARKDSSWSRGVAHLPDVGASIALGAVSAARPAGGRIQLFVQPAQRQGNGKVLFTGAIGDYGSSHSVNTAGKKVATATLTKGTIKLDLTAVANKANNANPTVDAATCSGAVSVSAPAPIIGGTGLYAGIHGTVKITESSGFIGSTYKSGPQKGRCNMSNSAPTVAEMAAVYGNGTVSF